MIDDNFYLDFISCIEMCDMKKIDDMCKILINNNNEKDIKFPCFILFALDKYLESPSFEMFNIIMTMYYTGFQPSSFSYIVSNKKCDRYRKKLFEIELQYCIDTNNNKLSNVWSRYAKSIYSESYKNTYEYFVMRDFEINKNYFDFMKLVVKHVFMCENIIFNNKKYEEDDEDNDEIQII